MKDALVIVGKVFNQLINIKKTSLDSELKASVTIEFMVTDDQSMTNFMRLARMQGDAASFCAEPAQPDMFDKTAAESNSAGPDGNGHKEEELALAEK
jgi:hypothetical protein